MAKPDQKLSVWSNFTNTLGLEPRTLCLKGRGSKLKVSDGMIAYLRGLSARPT